jgi:hypothetical protein
LPYGVDEPLPLACPWPFPFIAIAPGVERPGVALRLSAEKLALLNRSASTPPPPRGEAGDMEPGEMPYGFSLPLAVPLDPTGPQGMVSVPGTGLEGVAAR